LRASVGSTEASNSRLARVGVVGPKRARTCFDRSSGAVVDRSSIGAISTIGARTHVYDSDLPANSNVPAGAIIIDNKRVGAVEW
jgi:hypothetical protein